MTAVIHAFPDQATEARRLADALGLELGLVDVHEFPDGEIVPRVPVPAETTIVYRSLNRPNVRLVELLLAADAWRSHGAQRLVLVAPYLPYMRQDTAFRIGEPVSQRVVAELLDRAFDRLVTVDPHLHRTPSLAKLFPTCETTHLFGADALVPHLRASRVDAETLVVGPDIESGPWAARIAEPLGLTHTTLCKVRRGDADVDLRPPAGFEPSGRPVLLVDDICSTGGTLLKAVALLKSAGAGPITVFITHAIGGAAATDRLLQAGAAEVIATDSCRGPVSVVHLAGLLAQSLNDIVC
jgi:ribose-phosphate pyrophosphokinase